MSTLQTIFAETFNQQDFFANHFPRQLLENQTFVVLDTPNKQELTITFTRHYVGSSPRFDQRGVVFFYLASWRRRREGAITLEASRESSLDVITRDNNPYLLTLNEYHIPLPVNDPVDIVFDGKASIWPRWMVEMAPVIDRTKLRPCSVFIEVGQVVRELGMLPDTLSENIEINSPLIWWLAPNERITQFVARYDSHRAHRKLRSIYQAATTRSVEQAEREVQTTLQSYLAANRSLAIAQKGVDGFMEHMFAELESAVANDPQVWAVWIDDNAEVWAVVGEIITQNKINFGHFLLNLSRQRAWNLTKKFTSYVHANIGGSNGFCMGGTGGKDYMQLVGEGKFSGALVYFIYRLSNPGGNGFRPHNPYYVPDYVLYPETILTQRIADGVAASIWHQEKEGEQIRSYFQKAFANPQKTPSPRQKSTALPYLHTLRSYQLSEVHDFLLAAGIDLSELTTESLFAETAFDMGLIPDVLRVVSYGENEEDGEEEEYVVWERPRTTYKIKRTRRTGESVDVVASDLDPHGFTQPTGTMTNEIDF